MKKKVLTEQVIYTDEIKLPKGFEINPLDLSQDVLKKLFLDKNSIQSKHFDQLNRYIIENCELRYKLKLINKKTWGTIFTPNEEYTCLSSVDPIDLKNSPDFVCLYGINTEECYVTIFYDDNRRKGKNFKLPLKYNSFIMFPSTNTYTIYNNQKSSLNFIQTITFEYF
jgi:hypothetical protein